mmetsp:Transcript_1472/g.3558  ORF Transcript_1472/g.3558 Transcript_1472/m.3558 type:complete len:126 (-) Transcript_1472:1443-1820(-)
MYLQVHLKRSSGGAHTASEQTNDTLGQKKRPQCSLHETCSLFKDLPKGALWVWLISMQSVCTTLPTEKVPQCTIRESNISGRECLNEQLHQNASKHAHKQHACLHACVHTQLNRGAWTSAMHWGR